MPLPGTTAGNILSDFFNLSFIFSYACVNTLYFLFLHLFYKCAKLLLPLVNIDLLKFLSLARHRPCPGSILCYIDTEIAVVLGDLFVESMVISQDIKPSQGVSTPFIRRCCRQTAQSSGALSGCLFGLTDPAQRVPTSHLRSGLLGALSTGSKSMQK